jgi:glycosyltransferase involved in cell wall biosynthesis
VKIACICISRIPSVTANSIQVMKACHALQQNGHSVQLWAPEGEPIAWDGLAQHYGLETPFEVNWLLSPSRLRRYDYSLRSVFQARAWGADVLYTWTPQAALPALWLGMPAILELHAPVTGRLGPLLMRGFLRRAGKKRLLVITRALQRILEQDFPGLLRADEVQIAPNGMDWAQYANLPPATALRQQLGLPDGLTVGYTGHFYAGRGIDLLFELARAFPQVNFLWVGGRPADQAEWQARLSAAGLSNITLTGFQAQQKLPLYQGACDVLLMPYGASIAGSSGGDSAAFCSPMKMFDYLAAGRAILTSDLPVIHEVLNESNALFCPPDDLPAWQQALAALINDPSLRKRLSEQARRDAQRYTWRARAVAALANF